MTLAREANEVLEFWFGTLDAHGLADEVHSKRWFAKDPAFDELIRSRFGALHAATVRGEHDAWAATPRGRVAGIIVLDQFTRNMYRNTPKMVGADEVARRWAHEGLRTRVDRELRSAERQFFYMPLMHSELLDDQERCVELFQELAKESPGTSRERNDGLIKFAVWHRDIVKRFGRFPHRNVLLSRTSTGEEIEYLKTPGSSF